jgi:chemotaxis family two-component system response regulator Rcp1
MTKVTKKRTSISILLVEDSPAHAFLTREILAESEKAFYEISTVKDGIEAISYLYRINGYEHAPKPDLILLDLNLPRMHGFAFLARIKTDAELKTIPVCILTASEARTDIKKAKVLNADCYLIKPLDLEKFETTFSGIIASLLQ